MIVRIKNLSAMPKDRWLKEVPARMTLRQAKALCMSSRTVYYFKRGGKWLPLLFEDCGPIEMPEKEQQVAAVQLALLPMEDECPL